MMDWAWGNVRAALTRQYRVPPSMILLMGMVPLYIFIAGWAREAGGIKPHTFIDDLFPVILFWSLVYGTLYLFLILLPVLIIQEERLLRATFRAYVVVWAISYAVFILFPSEAPRPSVVDGEGFSAWGLRFLYQADPPHNVFPSLHVAHTVISALACHRVHRGLGKVAAGCVFLVALSTLFTKQHYVLDVAAGVALALLVGGAFMRGFSADHTAKEHRLVAPGLAVFCAGLVGAITLAFFAAYLFDFELQRGPVF
jgi:membrane-associated phospholipid phosphatase